MNYSQKIQALKEGRSSTLEQWRTIVPDLTAADLLTGYEWIAAGDPHTRSIALGPRGIVRLRVDSDWTGTRFYEVPERGGFGVLWCGASIPVPAVTAHEKMFADENGCIPLRINYRVDWYDLMISPWTY